LFHKLKKDYYMGYAVLHMEKTSGTDAAMSAHIERTIKPKNADESRTHLNRELITFPDGVESRTQAIQHRLDTAGLTRKIGNTWYMIETECGGDEQLPGMMHRLIFSDKGAV